MFCPKCGAQLPDGTTFCTNCGAALSQQEAPQQAAPQQTYQQPQQGYQQPYQQQPYQQTYQQPYQAPVQELPTQPFTSKGIIATLIYNLTKPKLWGIPQFIALGAAFFYFIAMLLPYMSYSIASTNYFSAGASSIIPAFLLIFFVAGMSFTKNGCMMIIAGGVMFFFSVFRGAMVSGGVSLSVGFVFMLLASLAATGAGVYQFILEQKK